MYAESSKRISQALYLIVGTLVVFVILCIILHATHAGRVAATCLVTGTTLLFAVASAMLQSGIGNNAVGNSFRPLTTLTVMLTVVNLLLLINIPNPMKQMPTGNSIVYLLLSMIVSMMVLVRWVTCIRLLYRNSDLTPLKTAVLGNKIIMIAVCAFLVVSIILMSWALGTQNYQTPVWIVRTLTLSAVTVELVGAIIMAVGLFCSARSANKNQIQLNI